MNVDEQDVMDRVIANLEELSSEELESVENFLICRGRAFLSVSETASLLNVNADTVRRYIREGHLKASRISPRSDWRISYHTIAKLLDGDIYERN
jgi:excisionase family DNA binding protein